MLNICCRKDYLDLLNKSRYGLFVFCLIVTNLFVSGQKQSDFTPVEIGDKVPDFELRNMLNHPVGSARIKDFQGKYIILDFWNSGCSSCVDSWPRLLELQSKYKDKLQIILVNPKQKNDLIQKLFSKRKNLTGLKMNLASSSGDIRLLELFPHSGVPFIVWISTNGLVVGKSLGSSVNEKNIEDFINNRDMKLPIYVPFNERVNVDFDNPFFFFDKGSPNDALNHSIFKTANPKVNPVTIITREKDISKGNVQATAANTSILNMYRLAYSQDNILGSFRGHPLNRTVLDVSDKHKYTGKNEHKEFINEYRFTYQFFSKRSLTRQEIKKEMQKDLDRYVGLQAGFEKRKVPCYVLTAIRHDKISYEEGDSTRKLTDSGLELNNITIDNFLEGLAYHYHELPVLDETGFAERLGRIEFRGNVLNFEELNKGLKRYGMALTIEDREIDILVIKEPMKYVFRLDLPSVKFNK